MKIQLLLSIFFICFQATFCQAQICPTGPRVPDTHVYMPWLVGDDPAHPYEWEAHTNLPVGQNDYLPHPLLGSAYPGTGIDLNVDMYEMRAHEPADLANLDYRRDQGWELVSKADGTPTPNNEPVFVFYNRFYARLRIYVDLTKSNDNGYNTGSVCLYFGDQVASNLFQVVRNLLYQSKNMKTIAQTRTRFVPTLPM